MKYIKFLFLFALAAFLVFFIGKSILFPDSPYKRNGKMVYPAYRYDYHRYSDSFWKYSGVNNKCGEELRDYYFKKSKELYSKMYPQGNPFDDPEKKITDTVCYPIQ